jgi:dynein heavy chain
LKLFDYKDAVEEVTEQAKNEAKMEKNLNKIDEKWRDVEFELLPHKESTEIKILKMSDENFETLEEH